MTLPEVALQVETCMTHMCIYHIKVKGQTMVYPGSACMCLPMDTVDELEELEKQSQCSTVSIL